MSILTDEEIQALADSVNELIEEGLDVSLGDVDLGRVFVVVIAANIVAYSSIVGIKALVKRVAEKRKIKLVIVKDDTSTT